MKTLSKILTAATIASTIFFPVKADIKENTKELGKTVLENAIRKENKLATFEFPEQIFQETKKEIIFKDNYGKIDSKVNEVNYLLTGKENSLYFSISPKDFDKTSWKDTAKEKLSNMQRYSRINESTMLVVVYPATGNITDISQQGYFIKQNTFNQAETSLEKKGMIELEKNEDAKKVLDLGEKIIGDIGEKIPFFEKAYPKFLKYNKEKAEKDLKEIGEQFGKEYKILLIPTYVPDKLTGQILTRLDYKITMDKPAGLILYSVANFGNPANMDNYSGTAAEGFGQIIASFQLGRIEKPIEKLEETKYEYKELPKEIIEKNGDKIILKKVVTNTEGRPNANGTIMNYIWGIENNKINLSNLEARLVKDYLLTKAEIFNEIKEINRTNIFAYDGTCIPEPSDQAGYTTKIKMKGKIYIITSKGDIEDKKNNRGVEPDTLKFNGVSPIIGGIQIRRLNFNLSGDLNKFKKSNIEGIYFSESDYSEELHIKEP